MDIQAPPNYCYAVYKTNDFGKEGWRAGVWKYMESQKSIRRRFRSEEEAKAFIIQCFDDIRNNRPITRKSKVEANRENMKLARAAWLPERRKKLAFVYLDACKKDGWRKWRAGVRAAPGGKWKYKAFYTEAEANDWVKVCMTALIKQKAFKEQQEQISVEEDYTRTMGFFREAVAIESDHRPKRRKACGVLPSEAGVTR